MGLLRFYSATIRLLYLLLRLERVRLGLFSRALVILSTLILFIPLAYPQAINIHNGRAYMPISEVSPAGVQRIRYLNGGFDAIYHPAKDLSRIRSAASGATAVARVPVVVRRSVPAVRVAARLSSKLRYAKITPQSLIAGLILDAALQKLLEEEGGYEYDPVRQNFYSHDKSLISFKGMVKQGETVELAWLGVPEKFGSVEDMMKNPYYARRIDELCRASVEKVIAANPFYEGAKYKGYDGNSCNVEKSGGQYWAVLLRIRANTDKRPISDSELQQVLTKYIENHPNPEKVLEAAEIPESDWGAPKVLITEETIINSEPYTDSRDGKAKQSQFRLWPCGGETCATETIKERPDLKPNSPEAPTVTPGGDVGDKTGDKDKTDNQQPPPFDLCKEHPDILACQGMGDVKGNEFDDIKIPRHVNQETWKPDSFLPDNGVCPAPKTFHVLGKQFSVGYEPLCVLMEKVRFIVLIAFILMSAYVAFGGLRKG